MTPECELLLSIAKQAQSILENWDYGMDTAVSKEDWDCLRQLINRAIVKGLI